VSIAIPKSISHLKWAFAILIVCSGGCLNAQTIAQLVTPQDRSTSVMTPVTFSWQPIDGATAYYLYIGTAAGLKNVYDSGETLQTSIVRSLDAGTYYITLWTEINNRWYSNTSSFTTLPAATRLLNPADGALVSGPQISLRWNSVGGALAYYLYVGSALGLKDVYDSGETQQLAITRTLSPGKYYARIWTKLNGVWYANDSTFTVLSSPAVLSTPANIATTITSPVTFSWKQVDDARNYYLYVGSAPGLKDLVDSGETEKTQITRVLSAGTYYATLWTQFSTGWMSSSSSFTVVQPAVLKTPADKALDVPTNVTFRWDPVSNVQAYYLYVGTAPGLKDVVNSGETLQTSITRNLPSESTYYVTLFTKFGNQWLSTASSFFIGTSAAEVVWPVDGASGVDPMRSITWTSVPNAQAYYLYVGTQPGLKDVYDSGETLLTSIAPPTIGENQTYFATLYTKKNDRWQSTALSFSTGFGFAKFISPSAAATPDPESPFAWTEAPGPVDAYQLTIGSKQGAADVFNSGNTAARSMRVPLAYGRAYFARLTTKKYGNARWVELPFQTLKQEDVPNIEERKQSLYDNVRNLTRDVRLMADRNNYPIEATVLADWVTSANRTQATCADYSLLLRKNFEDHSVLARVRNITLNGNGYENHTLVEFYDPFLDHWTVTDPTFAYIYWDSDHTGKSVEELNAALLANMFGSVPLEFVTDYADQLATHYYMDPVTLFANYYEPESSTARTDNPPDDFLEEAALDRVGAAGIYTFKAENADQKVLLNDGSVLTGMNGTLFTQAISLPEGWQFQSEGPVKIYTFKRLRF
jgi:hypothetical protein